MEDKLPINEQSLPPITPFKTWEWIRRNAMSNIKNLEKDLSIQTKVLELCEQKVNEEAQKNHK